MIQDRHVVSIKVE